MKRISTVVLLVSMSLLAPTSGKNAECSNIAFKKQMAMAFISGKPNVFWVSLPYRSAYSTASAICSAIPNTVAIIRYNTSNDSYTTYSCGDALEDFAVSKGLAYGVVPRASVATDIVGSHDDDYAVPLNFYDKTPSATWVSVPYHSRSTTAEAVCDENATAFISIEAYDPATETYSLHTCQQSGNDFAIVTGVGYRIKVNSSTNWIPNHY